MKGALGYLTGVLFSVARKVYMQLFYLGTLQGSVKTDIKVIYLGTPVQCEKVKSGSFTCALSSAM